MDGKRRSVVIALVVLAMSAAIPAETHRLVVNGDELKFVAAPERGYVVKLAERTGGVTALSGISTLDAGDAVPVCGPDRRGVWIVEKEGPSSRNKASIRSLSNSRQVAYAAPLFSSNGETVAIIPEIVVRVKTGVEVEAVQTLCEAAGCTVRKLMEFTTQEYLIEVLGPDAEAVFAAVEALSRSPEVEWACPNTAFRPRLAGQTALGHGMAPLGPMISSTGDPNMLGVFPNDEYFPNQWHLHNTGQSGGTPDADINAPEAWEITTGDPNVIVALLDTGVDMNHPDLVDNLISGYDFEQDDASPEPRLDWPMYAHGTACAGLIAASGDNGLGVTGVAWSCKVMPVRLDVSGAMPVSSTDIATALRWSASEGADILTNSWGFYGPVPIIHAAIQDITKSGGIGRNGKGCVVVFASGNDRGPLHWPAVYPEVVAIGATDHNDVHYRYSNSGPGLDMVAPSGCADPRCSFFVNLWTTDISGPLGLSGDPDYTLGLLDYTAIDGTSASAPIVAGVAALVLSVEPDLANEEVRHFLERSAKDLGEPGWDQYYGWGRVDARAALDMVLAKRADLNDDWRVDLDDLVKLIETWGAEDGLADIAPATKRDGIVDDQDLELLMQYWQVEIPPMDAGED